MIWLMALIVDMERLLGQWELEVIPQQADGKIY
jgi:hypothetical protein